MQSNKREFRKEHRILVLIFAGIIFLVVLPLFLILVPGAVDSALTLPRFVFQPFNFISALVLMIPGFLFAVWTVWIQFSIGKGTPIPKMPPTRLLTGGPFAYCRNPMSFGSILLYLGIGVWIGSLSSLALTGMFAALLLTYIKFWEEKELEERFGQEYIEYKKRTSFLIPRRRKNNLKR